jgi:hypothetical protein
MNNTIDLRDNKKTVKQAEQAEQEKKQPEEKMTQKRKEEIIRN